MYKRLNFNLISNKLNGHKLNLIRFLRLSEKVKWLKKIKRSNSQNQLPLSSKIKKFK